MRKLITTFTRPATVTVMFFAAWYSNLFEDTGRKRNIIPRAYPENGGSSVRAALAEGDPQGESEDPKGVEDSRDWLSC